ncbi:MAG TPA: RsmG family class I SAM-dependent methyltransferase [Acidimicrobiales bacterium]|nr:RsmG family class I SAM-dependent methyltransferase [Acidimicrobiales bacterium]
MTPSSLVAVLEEARDLGFLGPGPVTFHVEHARAYLPALAGVAGAALDLGTGGGVPGLVLAAERPDLAWTFVDAMQKRTAFLARAVAALGLEVAVRTDRAEALADLRASQDAVVARSFGAPAVTAECAAPLLRVGGRLVVSEPPDGEDRWEGAALLGLGTPERRPGPPALVVLTQVAPCPARYPRKTGQPSKRPLW